MRIPPINSLRFQNIATFSALCSALQNFWNQNNTMKCFIFSAQCALAGVWQELLPKIFNNYRKIYISDWKCLELRKMGFYYVRTLAFNHSFTHLLTHPSWLLTLLFLYAFNHCIYDYLLISMPNGVHLKIPLNR